MAYEWNQELHKTTEEDQASLDKSIWHTDFDAFSAKLNGVKGHKWWCQDMALKYLDIRIDTRDNGYILSIKDYDETKHFVHPNRVYRAIDEYCKRFSINQK